MRQIEGERERERKDREICVNFELTIRVQVQIVEFMNRLDFPPKKKKENVYSFHILNLVVEQEV